MSVCYVLSKFKLLCVLEGCWVIPLWPEAVGELAEFGCSIVRKGDRGENVGVGGSACVRAGCVGLCLCGLGRVHSLPADTPSSPEVVCTPPCQVQAGVLGECGYRWERRRAGSGCREYKREDSTTRVRRTQSGV